jgi:hypothetical protein
VLSANVRILEFVDKESVAASDFASGFCSAAKENEHEKARANMVSICFCNGIIDLVR